MKIAEEVARALESAPATRPLSFVIEWEEGPLNLNVSRLISRQERREAIKERYDSAKEPVLSALRDEPHVDVNEMAGTGQAVVMASAEEWRKLLDHPVIQEAEGRIFPNERFEKHGFAEGK